MHRRPPSPEPLHVILIPPCGTLLSLHRLFNSYSPLNQTLHINSSEMSWDLPASSDVCLGFFKSASGGGREVGWRIKKRKKTKIYFHISVCNIILLIWLMSIFLVCKLWEIEDCICFCLSSNLTNCINALVWINEWLWGLRISQTFGAHHWLWAAVRSQTLPYSHFSVVLETPESPWARCQEFSETKDFHPFSSGLTS